MDVSCTLLNVELKPNQLHTSNRNGFFQYQAHFTFQLMPHLELVKHELIAPFLLLLHSLCNAGFSQVHFYAQTIDFHQRIINSVKEADVYTQARS